MSEYTLVRCGTLIDGRGGEPAADAALLLKGSRIAAAGKYEETAKEAPAGTPILDYHDKYVTCLLYTSRCV